jgi:hypothetical protein
VFVFDAPQQYFWTAECRFGNKVGPLAFIEGGLDEFIYAIALCDAETRS